jgi:dihydroxy-acid dehydratase
MTKHGLGTNLTEYGDREFALYLRRSFAKAMGFSDEALSKPIVGILNTYSELNNCHRTFPQLVDAVKRGVWQAGGLPLEFPTISLGEVFLSPSAMLYRNLMALDVETMLRAQPLDAVVLTGGCDKTLPALLMGAASAGLPVIVVAAGPMLANQHEGERIGACTDCRRYWGRYRRGEIDRNAISTVEGRLAPTPGTCGVMGTASTMACLAEALGLMLPGGAAIPAVYADRMRHAEEAGKRACKLAEEGLTPDKILTPGAFENALRVLQAIGGSTNAVIHLTAIAGRLGIALDLARLNVLADTTPVLVDLKPTGEGYMEDFFRAGGMPLLLRELKPLLSLDERTVTGQTWAELLEGEHEFPRWQTIVRPRAEPLQPAGALISLRGSLAPDGALIKRSAADQALLNRVGRAVVFKGLDDLAARIDSPDLDVAPDDFLVLQNAGPLGAPGMPEAGYLPIPKKLVGVKDMVRISDARMSGTAFGTVVLHVSPEAAAGGPLGLVRDGDLIELSVERGTLDLLVDEAELARRRAEQPPPAAPPARGYELLYSRHVQQAHLGADFDFLRHPSLGGA